MIIGEVNIVRYLCFFLKIGGFLGKIKCQNQYMQRISAFPLQVSEKWLNELSNDWNINNGLLEVVKNERKI